VNSHLVHSIYFTLLWVLLHHRLEVNGRKVIIFSSRLTRVIPILFLLIIVWKRYWELQMDMFCTDMQPALRCTTSCPITQHEISSSTPLHNGTSRAQPCCITRQLERYPVVQPASTYSGVAHRAARLHNWHPVMQPGKLGIGTEHTKI